MGFISKDNYEASLSQNNIEYCNITYNISFNDNANNTWNIKNKDDNLNIYYTISSSNCTINFQSVSSFMKVNYSELFGFLIMSAVFSLMSTYTLYKYISNQMINIVENLSMEAIIISTCIDVNILSILIVFKSFYSVILIQFSIVITLILFFNILLKLKFIMNIYKKKLMIQNVQNTLIMRKLMTLLIILFFLFTFFFMVSNIFLKYPILYIFLFMYPIIQVFYNVNNVLRLNCFVLFTN